PSATVTRPPSSATRPRRAPPAARRSVTSATLPKIDRESRLSLVIRPASRATAGDRVLWLRRKLASEPLRVSGRSERGVEAKRFTKLALSFGRLSARARERGAGFEDRGLVDRAAATPRKLGGAIEKPDDLGRVPLGRDRDQDARARQMGLDGAEPPRSLGALDRLRRELESALEIALAEAGLGEACQHHQELVRADHLGSGDALRIPDRGDRLVPVPLEQVRQADREPRAG